jgi:predicted nucleic acid-binding protein
MRTAFADACFYIAAVNPRDELHERASALMRSFRGRSVTTEYVLIEVGNELSRSGDRPVFLDLMDTLQADRYATVIPADHALFASGVEFFRERMDKDWSLTDCISFVVMKQHRLADALTADHHFEQAGFNILLK